MSDAFSREARLTRHLFALSNEVLANSRRKLVFDRDSFSQNAS